VYRIFPGRFAYSVFQAIAAHRTGPNGNIAISDFDGPAGILEERTIPSIGFYGPRSHEYTITHCDNPNADKSVRFLSGPNGKDLRSVKNRD